MTHMFFQLSYCSSVILFKIRLLIIRVIKREAKALIKINSKKWFLNLIFQRGINQNPIGVTDRIFYHNGIVVSIIALLNPSKSLQTTMLLTQGNWTFIVHNSFLFIQDNRIPLFPSSRLCKYSRRA